MYRVRLLHTETCHAYHQAFNEIEKALKEKGLPVYFEVILITSQEQAEQYKFFGSPTVQINGEDIDPKAKMVTKYSISSCRPYFWKGRFYDYPPKEMILEALK
jgi:hypothetical protein